MKSRQKEYSWVEDSYKRVQEIKRARANNPLHISAKAIREAAVNNAASHGMSIEKAERDIRLVISDIPEIVRLL